MIIQDRIEQKLQEAFQPLHLEVINESHNHSVPAGSESHFKVLMVASAFQSKPTIGRHRMVNKVLADELANHIHALTMKLMTPKQWEEAGQVIEQESPQCASKARV